MNLPPIGEELTKMMWKSLVDRGIGGLFKPWHIRRVGRAEAEVARDRALTIAQADRDVEDIQAGRKRLAEVGGKMHLLPADAQIVDGRVEPTFDIAAALSAASEARALNDLREEINVSKVIAQAESMLLSDAAEVPDRTVDPDWLTRWRDSAAKVTSTDLQSLWAKILAEEVKVPGLFSLRTLDFLKNLSAEEARKIQRLAKFVVNGAIVPVYGDLRPNLNTDPDLPEYFQQLGILGGAGRLGISLMELPSLSPESLHAVVEFADRKIALRAAKGVKCGITGYRATQVGIQVLTLCRMPPSEEFYRSVIEEYKAQGFQVSEEAH